MPEELTPDQTSGAYQAMAPRWELVRTLLGGTEALRQAGEKYLPRYQAEAQKSWEERIRKATLLNYFERTIAELTSKTFAKDIDLSDQPAWFDSFIEDVDRQGNNLTTFCRNVFESGLADGFAAVLVDHTRLAPGATRADELTSGAGPYFVHIDPRNIIAAYAEMVDGQERFTHVRIRESEVVRDGFGEYVVDRIRVWEPGIFTLYRFDVDAKRWYVEDEGQTSLPYVPLVLWYTGRREGVGLCKPPLLDLAYLNIQHYQGASDQGHCLTVARFPILAVSGMAPEEAAAYVVGPNAVLASFDVQSKWYYVEHTGAAIDAGRKDLEELEDRMALIAVDLQVRRPGNQTATAEAIGQAKAISIIEALANTFSDALEYMAWFAGLWRGEDIKITARLSSDLGVDLANKTDLDALLKARQAGEISRETLLGEFKRRGVLSADFDPEADQERLDEEAPNLSAGVMDPFDTQEEGIPDEQTAVI